MLEKEKYEFILGARLRSLSDKWQDRILDNTDYEKIEKSGEVIRLSSYRYTKNRRLIVSHSSKRAEKDRSDREKAIVRLNEKLEKSKNPKSLISNYGYKKYLTMEGEIRVRVNQEKLERESLWDGLHGVFTNIDEKEMDAEAILSQYHGLWQVEESFRITKHYLRVRPVFHWSPGRIRSHLAICFVAFSLIRFLQHRIRIESNESISPERIKDELFWIQESLVKDITNNNTYVIPSNTSPDAMKIYEAMNLKRHTAPFKLVIQR